MRILLHNDDVVEVRTAHTPEIPEVVLMNIGGRLLSFSKRFRNDCVSDFVGILHSHPKMENKCNIDQDHVIVDKKDWKKIRHLLRYEVLNNGEIFN